MYTPTMIVSVIAALLLAITPAIGSPVGNSTLSKREPPLRCGKASGIAIFSPDWDMKCRLEEIDGKMLIPGFFAQLVWDIGDSEMYGNYAKIMCHGYLPICSFMTGLPEEQYISGKQLKKMFNILAAWCDLSHCGSVEAWKVHGDGFLESGILKIDGVKDKEGCDGICA